MTYFGKLYLSNKMTGIPCFNAPWFDLVAGQLRSVTGVAEVFNPADEDRKVGFDPLSCPTGTTEEAVANGFIARRALGSDWKWIADHADGLVVGPLWPESGGAISEIACAQALGLPVWESSVFFDSIRQGRGDLLTCPGSGLWLPSFKELLHAYA